jgi:hypothetical protein
MKHVIRAIGAIFFGLVFLFLVMTGIGTSMPIDHDATCTGVYHQNAERIFDAIADDGASIAWRTDLRSITSASGSGSIAVWRETNGQGQTVDYQTVVSVRPSLLIRQIVPDPGLQFGGVWTYRVGPYYAGAISEGNSLQLSEHGQIYNPFFRFMARFVFGYESTMRTYLGQLGTFYHEKPQIWCGENP